MKYATFRRIRRRSTNVDPLFNKKSSQQEPAFFGSSAESSFFQPMAVQRKCEKCDEEEKAQKKSDSANSSPTAYVSSVSSGGIALPKSLSSYFSSRLNRDLSSVKVHTGSEADRSAKAIRAQAYTYGNNIVFAHGKYDPGTDAGNRLLLHELTHVVQQQGVQRKLQLSPEEENQPADNAGIDRDQSMENEARANEEAPMTPVTLPDITTYGKPAQESVFGKSVSFSAETKADFDGGVGATSALKAMPAKDCEGCEAGECMTVTGKFTITYSVSTSVELPGVPEGLTPCQAKRVEAAINGPLAAHEQKHVSAFNLYNGKVTLPINYKGCKSGIEPYLQNLNDVDGEARKASVSAKSKALDPFFVNVDMDCEEPEPPKK